MISILIIIVAVILFPRDAHAWGPIAHLDFASAVLTNITGLFPAVKLVLEKHPNDFLYGSIAADITVGKKYIEYLHNCHNWQVGFLLLNEAKDGRQKACAYGYLSHLAADVVAHNFYAPYHMIKNFKTRVAGHVYWEMRFDAWEGRHVWELVRRLSKLDFSHDDELFRKVVKRTLFSFKTNKRIFNSIMTINRIKQWEKAVKTFSAFSKLKVDEKNFGECRALAIASSVSFLKDPQRSRAVGIDPTGEHKLSYAKDIRKKLKKSVRKKTLKDKEVSDFMKKVYSRLKDGIYKDTVLPAVIDIIDERPR